MCEKHEKCIYNTSRTIQMGNRFEADDKKIENNILRKQTTNW